MATIKSRVLSKLGQNNFTFFDDIANIRYLFSDAIWKALTVHVDPHLISSALEPTPDPANVSNGDALVADGEDVSNKHILMVIRTAANHILDENDAIQTERYFREHARKITVDASYKALDADSIYFATNTSPVYWIQSRTVEGNKTERLYTAPPTEALTISNTNPLPNGKAGLQIYAIKRFDFPATNPTDQGSEVPVLWDTIEQIPIEWTLDSNAISIDTALPEEAENLVITIIAQAVLIEKLANASIQDEDTEVVALIQSQLKAFAEEIELETKRIDEAWGIEK